MALPWSFVSKITNPKHQITNKSQITNSKPAQRAAQVLAPRERLFFCLGYGRTKLKFKKKRCF
jgi:hypothetical protein